MNVQVATNRHEWLELRMKGIGGSDAAAILGLDPYKSPFDVYAEKLGLKPEQPDNEAMRQGRDLEQYFHTCSPPFCAGGLSSFIGL